MRLSRTTAALALAFLAALAGCKQRAETPQAAAPSSIPAPAPPGPQPQADATATQRAQASGLPDFTVLVDSQGPAVVNVVTTRSARGGGGGEAADDPLFDFFRRFMPQPPDPGPGGPEGRGQGLGSGFIIS